MTNEPPHNDHIGEAWETALGLVTASIGGSDDAATDLMGQYLQPSIHDDGIDPAEFIPRILALVGVLSAALSAAVAVPALRAGKEPSEVWQDTLTSGYASGALDALIEGDIERRAEAIEWLIDGGWPKKGEDS